MLGTQKGVSCVSPLFYAVMYDRGEVLVPRVMEDETATQFFESSITPCLWPTVAVEIRDNVLLPAAMVVR